MDLERNDDAEAGSITLATNHDYICAACTCGTGSMTPIRHALDQGAISCDCGAQVIVDSVTVDRLKAEEPEFRL